MPDKLDIYTRIRQYAAMHGNAWIYNGAAIGEFRKVRLLDRKVFASAAGIGLPHLTNIENGNRQPSDALAMRMAQILGITDLRAIMGAVPKGRIKPDLEPVA